MQTLFNDQRPRWASTTWTYLRQEIYHAAKLRICGITSLKKTHSSSYCTVNCAYTYIIIYDVLGYPCENYRKLAKPLTFLKCIEVMADQKSTWDDTQILRHKQNNTPTLKWSHLVQILTYTVSLYTLYVYELYRIYFMLHRIGQSFDSSWENKCKAVLATKISSYKLLKSVRYSFFYIGFLPDTTFPKKYTLGRRSSLPFLSALKIRNYPFWTDFCFM